MSSGLLALAGLLVLTRPIAAQVGPVLDAPLTFGIAWSRGTPSTALAAAIEPPRGFTASISLPVTRRSAIGIRGEFSILTIPSQALVVSYTTPSATVTLDATVRGTIGFTGAGPRVAMAVGPIELGVAALAGVTRVITDASAQASSGDLSISTSASSSDFTYGVKAVLDGYLPLYRGVRGTSIGLAVGIDYLTGGPVVFARRSSFRVNPAGDLVIGRAATRPTMLVLRAGLGGAF